MVRPFLSPLPSRGRAVALASVTATAMIAQQVAGKAVRDSLVLSIFGARALPGLMIGAAVLSLASAVLLARLIAGRGPARVVPAVFFTSAILLFAQGGLHHVSRPAATVALYAHMALFGSAVASGFWSLVNEMFDPHTARDVVAKIVSGSTLGGVVGGLIAWRGAGSASVSVLIPVVGAIHLACAVGAQLLGHGEPAAARPAPEPASPPAPSADRPEKRAPYLWLLAAMVGLSATVEAIFDYVFSASAGARFARGPELLRFFALFHTTTGLTALLVQWTLTRGALRRLGLAGTIALLPGAVIAGGVLGAAMPALTTIAAVRAGEIVVRASFFRAAYEVLFTPLPEGTKRRAKAIIDVGLDRAGTMLGGGVVAVLLVLRPATHLTVLLGIAVGLGVLALALAPRVHTGYVGELEKQLRSGAERLGDGPGAAVLTVPEPSGAVQRLLPSPAPARPRPLAPGDDPVLAAAADLRSGDARRALRALGAEPLSPPLVALAVPWLADESVERVAIAVLRRAAARSTGLLVDALLDPASPDVVRRRLPRVLVAVPTQRSADGLVQGLFDPSFEVRYRCGRALLRLSEKNPSLALPPAPIFEAAEREAAIGREVWESQRVVDREEDPEDVSVLDDLRERIGRSLEHVFTILSLALDREPLIIACRALHTDDASLRGTALEYLDNVLPPSIREALWPFLGDSVLPSNERRPASQLLDELLKLREAVTGRLGALGQSAGRA